MLPIMKPSVCIGPPLPYRKPPPHGTKHCQRNVPVVFGVMKLNFTMECGPEVHGDAPHALLLKSAVTGEAIGTNTCRLGIANVCPTVQLLQELTTEYTRGGPSGCPTVLNCCTVIELPTVPWTWLQKLLRSGVQPS